MNPLKGPYDEKENWERFADVGEVLRRLWGGLGDMLGKLWGGFGDMCGRFGGHVWKVRVTTFSRCLGAVLHMFREEYAKKQHMTTYIQPNSFS